MGLSSLHLLLRAHFWASSLPPLSTSLLGISSKSQQKAVFTLPSSIPGEGGEKK